MRIKFLVVLLLLSGPIMADDAKPFSIMTDDGEVTLVQLAGKVVYLDFWASWCEPCRMSFPFMNDLQKTYGDSGLVILAVNLDRDRTKADKFVQKNPASFIVGFDPTGSQAKAYDVKGMPSTFVIDRKGRLAFSHVGFREKDKATLQEAVASALNNK